MNARGALSYLVVSLSLVILLYSTLVSAQNSVTPEGPDLANVTNSSRGPENGTPVAIAAQAGNVSQMYIDDTRLTQAWQGYYGNVTGTITLQDSDGNIFYDWTLTDPQGEIFAVNSSRTVNWLEIHCLNVSQNEDWGGNNSDTNTSIPVTRPDGTVSILNSSDIEANFGINQSDHDGLNETYYDYFAGNIDVAGTIFDATDGCSMAHPYVSSAASTNWQQILLSDNASLIFTALLQADATDFRGETSDFQMLVLENGHPGYEAPSLYYFYVELS